MTNHRAWTRLFLTTALAGGMLFAVGSTARADWDHTRFEVGIYFHK